jgi:hypothetical protein
MRVFLLVVACLWLLVLPPFFTHGACSLEFDTLAAALDRARPELTTPERARAWLTSQGLSFRELSAEQCKVTREEEVEVCTGGPLLLAAVPVRNNVCHYYRDSTIRVQLGFNALQQLVRIQTDMKPDHRLRLFGRAIDWGS